MIASRKRKSTKQVDAEKLANNVAAVSKLNNLIQDRENGVNKMTDEDIFKSALGEEKHGYLRGYGRNKSITDYFGIKPGRMNLVNQVVEIEKKADEKVQEVKKLMEEKMDEKLAEHKKEREKMLDERDKMWEEKFASFCRSNGQHPSGQNHPNGSA